MQKQQTTVVAKALSTVKDELKKNPYCSVLKYNSTPKNHFIKDAENNVVNRYQKPLSLYLQLLKMFAPPGSTVFDFTMGTGSLELAAMEPSAPRELEFVAFERNPDQIKHEQLRLESAYIIHCV